MKKMITTGCDCVSASWINKLFLGLDVLINSAGIFQVGSTEKLQWSDYDACMAINAKAAFVLTQAAIPHLRKTNGNIVHISAVNGNQYMEIKLQFISLNVNIS